MGYPGTAYRSGSEKYGGGFQEPVVRPLPNPAGPANDNIPFNRTPANDNFARPPRPIPIRPNRVLLKGATRLIPWVGLLLTGWELYQMWQKYTVEKPGYIGSWVKCWSCPPQTEGYPLQFAYFNGWLSCPPAFLCGLDNQAFADFNYVGPWGFVRGTYRDIFGTKRAAWFEAWAPTAPETEPPTETEITSVWWPEPALQPEWIVPQWRPEALPILQPVPTPRPIPYPQIPNRPLGDPDLGSSAGNQPPGGRIDVPPLGDRPVAIGGAPSGNKRPPAGEKERKLKANAATGVLLRELINVARAHNYIDDLKDYTLAFHKALPKEYRSKQNDIFHKAEALWKNWDHLDWNQAIDNLMEEIAQDKFGKLSEILKSKIAKQQRWFKTKLYMGSPH